DRLAEAVKMVRRGSHFDSIEVTMAFEPVPAFRGRQAEIDQVFVNLISNAAQAMKGKGRLTLSTHRDGDWSMVQVSDTGCGIPESLVPRIFDPFFTTKGSSQGTGLGLSIVYEII